MSEPVEYEFVVGELPNTGPLNQLGEMSDVDYFGESYWPGIDDDDDQ